MMLYITILKKQGQINKRKTQKETGIRKEIKENET